MCNKHDLSVNYSSVWHLQNAECRLREYIVLPSPLLKAHHKQGNWSSELFTPVSLLHTPVSLQFTLVSLKSTSAAVTFSYHVWWINSNNHYHNCLIPLCLACYIWWANQARVLKNVLNREVPPQALTPYPFKYHFDRNCTLFLCLYWKKGTTSIYLKDMVKTWNTMVSSHFH